MTYQLLVIVAVIIAVVNVALIIYAYARLKDRKPLARDQVLGFLLAGPFFFFIDRGLRKRGHRLTGFEYYGMLAVALLVLIIVVGAIVTNFAKYSTLPV